MSWIVQSEKVAMAAGAMEEDEVLYAITVGDMVIAYEQKKGGGAWSQLSVEEKVSLTHRARQCMEGFCGEGMYNFVDALKDAIRDWERLASEVGELNAVPGDVAARDTV